MARPYILCYSNITVTLNLSTSQCGSGRSDERTCLAIFHKILSVHHLQPCFSLLLVLLKSVEDHKSTSRIQETTVTLVNTARLYHVFSVFTINRMPTGCLLRMLRLTLKKKPTLFSLYSCTKLITRCTYIFYVKFDQTEYLL